MRRNKTKWTHGTLVVVCLMKSKKSKNRQKKCEHCWSKLCAGCFIEAKRLQNTWSSARGSQTNYLNGERDKTWFLLNLKSQWRVLLLVKANKACYKGKWGPANVGARSREAHKDIPQEKELQVRSLISDKNKGKTYNCFFFWFNKIHKLYFES